MKREIVKASGEVEAFSRDKLQHSLEKAGVSAEVAKGVCDRVEEQLPERAASEEVLEITLRELRRYNVAAASRYNLKRAIMELGPTGYPFEDYVAGIMNAYGYTTKVGELVQGFCIEHEVDVLAEKNDGGRAMVEAKYHNDRGTKSDVQVALYTHARFLDIRKAWIEKEGRDSGDAEEKRFYDLWLVTNTKCTHDATAYAECNDFTVISWGYPEGNSLQEMIERKGLYPITMLPSMQRNWRDALFNRHITLASDIARMELKEFRHESGLDEHTAQTLYEEAQQLCRYY